MNQSSHEKSQESKTDANKHVVGEEGVLLVLTVSSEEDGQNNGKEGTNKRENDDQVAGLGLRVEME